MPVSIDERYKASVLMHTLQHQRWNQWSLFFFGSIVSIFALWAQIKAFVPLWAPSLLAFLISVGWVFSALGIRAMNRTWEEIVKAVEGGEDADIKPHHELVRRRAQFQLKQEFCEILTFWHPMTRHSVSRHLVWFGLLSSVVFAGLFIFGLMHPYMPDVPLGASRTTTTTTTTTTAAQAP